jgi:steroid delta-isomerase-like uncharacterized protein
MFPAPKSGTLYKTRLLSQEDYSMSTTENRAVLQRAGENFNNPKNRTAYFELYDPTIVLHGYQGVEPGLESVKQFYQAFWGAFPDCKLVFEEVFAEGDKVACRFVVYATHQGEFQGIPATGKRITLPGITILQFANGKCVERWSQADFIGLLQQLGVMPAPEPNK